jgi:hypothetical protein
MTIADHASHAPSGMAITIQCPASWRLQQLHPADKDSQEAAEGDAAHWVKSQYMKLSPDQRSAHPGIGTLAPNGIPVTDEMLDGAELYADSVGVQQFDEQRLPPSEDLGPDCWGTPDNWSYRPVQVPGTDIVGGVIEIPDYKFGHRFVDAYMNWQLITYACLILDMLKIDGLQEQHVRIIFKIVQPRNYDSVGPVREWSVLAVDLRAARNQIKAAIAAAHQEDAPARVGPECRDCTARAYCGTLQRASMAALDETGRITPLTLQPAELGLELRMITSAIERLKARASGLSEVALSTIRTGGRVPGYTVEIGQGREVWKIPVTEVASMGKLMGKVLVKETPITPKQAIKLGMDPALVASFTERRTGETKLVPDDGTLARRMFGGRQPGDTK